MSEIARVETGIPGLDKMLNGGLPKGRTILLSGPAGGGKTTLATQYIYRGILDHGDPGIYVTFDESPKTVRQNFASYNWKLESLEKENLLALVDGFSMRAGVASQEKYSIRLEIDDLLTTLITLIDELGAERVVIDSMTALALSLESELRIRREILKLSAVMSSLKCTTIVTSEMTQSGEISRYGVEEFMASGVIVLDIQEINQRLVRSIYIRKMRGINHELVRRPFELTQNGCVVLSAENLFV
ncbi:MAG TPA: ATPase domain-containing protein [Candidatus Bathyarchaeia archaeon]|nr:ATPase domain-containing protein [Candidatus Bathyarchaeia archaeon]